MDIAYVVRADGDNEELRYSLRSLKNLPHRDVYVIGDIPSWLRGVKTIQRPQAVGNDLFNVNASLLCLAERVSLSESFWYFNDDFYLLEPTKDIPYFHQGPLQTRVDQYFRSQPSQFYSLYKTQQELIRLGKTDLKSFELHVPIKFEKSRLKKMYADTKLPGFALRPRTMYCNLYNLSGIERTDVKDQRLVPGGDYRSTGGPFGEVWEEVKRRFPEPSPYEKT